MDRNLATLLMIAKTGNMTTAAEKLFITQPTLTKRLQQLEQTYGAKLVERLPRGARLTPMGEELLPFARRIEQSYLQANEALDAFKDGHLDEIRVGAGPLFHLRYLGKAFAILHGEFPDTRIRLTADVNSRNLPKIRRGLQDLMFGTTENLNPDDEVQFVPLTIVEQGVLVSADHPLAIRETVSAQDLQDVSWIVYSDTPENEEMTNAYFALQGLKPPNMVLQTSSFALGLQMLERSRSAMTVPAQLEPTLDRTRYKVLRPDPPISRKPAGAFFRSSSIAFPAVSRLIEIVQAQIG
ncbi:MAG: LysR family transcriptional regulator [Pseudomonadota bacterium]